MNAPTTNLTRGETNSSPVISIGESLQPVSYNTWLMKYQYKEDGVAIDLTIEDNWKRVAKALAKAEIPEKRKYWQARFYKCLSNFMFSPAGRILANAGLNLNTTMFNCFVMGDIPDDMAGIFDAIKEAALTMQQGGGIGYDFSTIRPKGAPVKGVGADASGPISFMDVWDSMCKTMMAAGSRRGAMMAVLRDDHPDILDFIQAKRTPGRLTQFNLSVLVSDALMEAVKNDGDWNLQFGGKIYRTLPARQLWDTIMESTYSFAEPGVIFIDRINKKNNLWYIEHIHGTNPCGEMPLPPYGLCLLGSINLARLVQHAFEPGAAMDEALLTELTWVAVRMLDDVIDVSNYPLPQHAEEARSKRRIGLGVTGLADALIMVGAVYGSEEAIALTDKWMSIIRREAYLASIDLAKEKGKFPLYDAEKYLAGENICSLDEDVQQEIAKHGIRNALITSIAPTGTISLIADNVSGGIEPVFEYTYTRKIRQADGERVEVSVSDYAYRVFRQKYGEDAPLTEAFVSAQTLSPQAHLTTQAVVQKYIDNSISKTINLRKEISFVDFKDVYLTAYELGCKGCTTYRPNDITGSVLSVSPAPEVKNEPEPTPVNIDLSRDAIVEKRPEELPGSTYQFKLASMDAAMYVTISDIISVDGKCRPYEIFVHSRKPEHYAWVTALTRMISAVFRRGGDVAFVAEELQAVFDPKGGDWDKGKYVPSMVAAIGNIIEKHLLKIGAIDIEDAFTTAMIEADAARADALDAQEVKPKGTTCPKCGAPAVHRHEGCEECHNCDYQKCG